MKPNDLAPAAALRFVTQAESDLPGRRLAAWIDSDAVKRLFDVIAASLLLVFLLPVMLLIAGVISVFHGGPVLFAHERIGRHGERFKCLKFRTMRTDADVVLEKCLATNAEMRAEWDATAKLKDDPRVMPIGEILRKSSLDELPQLFNVLRGQMSLVGPRPITFDESRHYGDDFIHYLAMRPGISGLWQVSGRNDTTYAERVSLDVDYARHRSFAGDFAILLRTVDVVFRGRGAY